ncbi:MAG TPA: rhodanese-related sulfurtransferase [Candidatus Babeliales bacterium]|nr:rhodanese-related sulfurtransferase [Candidatus Babeliales bacterium]
MGKITIFYKYVDIEYPTAIMKWQKKLCVELGLKGRILIAHEGINGTVGGTDEGIELYQKTMLEHPLFGGIDFKDSAGAADYFPRLRIAVRPEIVHLGLDTKKFTAKDAGKHLSPQQAHEFMAHMNEDTIVLDTRNSYEWKIGQFKTINTINAPTEYFREFPEFIDTNLETFKDKKILMACTSGVRCERASAYLKSKNVAKEVYQINGGIQRYTEQFPDGFFRGKNYVFDGRVTAKINDDCVGNCDRCNAPYDEPINCINAECNKQVILCDNCQSTLINTCSEICSQLVREHKVKVRTKPSRIGRTNQSNESDPAQCSIK